MTFISYAQNLEDVMLYRALKDVHKGFYIDVGAQDPVFDSVTNAFYERGWRGINIEPLQQWFDRLTAYRPDDINLQLAASSRTAVFASSRSPIPGCQPAMTLLPGDTRVRADRFTSGRSLQNAWMRSVKKTA